MALWIIDNPHARQVIAHLKSLCPDPGLSVQFGYDHDKQKRGSGLVKYVPTMSSVGSELVTFFTQPTNKKHVCIVGRPYDYLVRKARFRELELLPEERLGANAAVTTFDKYPDPSFVQIQYDVTLCDGAGRWVAGGKDGAPAQARTILFHELTHARRVLSGAFKVNNASAEEAEAIAQENVYRRSVNLRERTGTAGGCGWPRSGKPGCFVATAAFGSPLEPEVDLLRRFRDEIILKTRSGAAFFDEYWRHYYQVSPVIVRLMQEDPRVRDLVRWSVVTPIVRQLETVLAFPDAPLDDVPEPWQTFLTEMRDHLERWVQEVELPTDFSGLSAARAVEEISLVLRYMLRRPETRLAYLVRLRELGQLPLPVAPDEEAFLVGCLRACGRTDQEIEHLLGPATRPRSGETDR